jgi:hypothetical protein
LGTKFGRVFARTIVLDGDQCPDLLTTLGVIDWCAPPSGARLTPEGVPTRIDWPPA